MNKLLNPISWTAYLQTMAIIAIAYYAFIGWKYYRPEIQALIARITGQSYNDDELPAALQYQAEESPVTAPAIAAVTQPQTIAYEHLDREAAELAKQLQTCINSASGKPYAPASLIPQLKKILNDYPDIAATSDRETINDLIVRECEKTGTALLSESEVDLWWSA